MNEFIEKLIARMEECKEEECDESMFGVGLRNGYTRAINITKSIAAEYPSCDCSQCSRRFWYQKGYDDAKSDDGWIPCEKDLPPQPEENPNFENKPLELYLVSVKNIDFSFRAFWNGEAFTDGWGKLDVIAWQPLPKPYQTPVK